MRQARRRSEAAQYSVPAPIQGMVENDPTAIKGPLAAEWIENFLPTVRGLKVRGGTAVHATVAAACKTLMPYTSSESTEIFAATDSAIYAVNSSATEDDEIYSLTANGVWSSQQIGTSGGDYLVAVNGVDNAIIFDGGSNPGFPLWYPLVDKEVRRIRYDSWSANFETGETVTSSSGGTAVIVGQRFNLTTGNRSLFVTDLTGTFANGDTLTTASATATQNLADTSVLQPLAITGVATKDLSHVWLHQNRLFFVEKDTRKAWYLPAGAVGGAANDINLSGVFQRGGTLMFGATWSLDTGAGLDDKCVFVSSEGEVAIYSGTDPSSASTWSLEGRYDIGRPLSSRGIARIGGDLLIATDDGIVALSSALTKDPAELSLAAVTRPIRTTWGTELDRSTSNMQLFKWTSGEALVVLFPEASRALTANLQTQAWAIQTGWGGLCGAEVEGVAYVGQADGVIKQLDTTGEDMDGPFVAKMCGAFTHLGDALRIKAPSMMRGAYFADVSYTAKYGIAIDYNVTFPAPPVASSATGDALVWDVGSWNEKTWGKEVEIPTIGATDYWQSVTGAGWALAPTVQITSAGNTRLPVELVRVDVIVEGGGRAA